ncbi:MAG: maleylpyruvate isomerase N-terminal domain-containing protein [Gemmatimonadetes bacterium]|nr:maleylpyruvate isomerase N-terminal domain-containing protein [Gemmatimonadota bacterium]
MNQGPVPTAHLFAPLHVELMALLRGLSDEDWLRPTPVPEWRVRDVAAHLLDGDLRKLAVVRDAHFPPPPDDPLEGYEDLVRYLDGLNAQWLRAAERLSPRLIVELLDVTGPAVSALVESLDPHEPAPFAVAWAGEEASPNWMDVGRDYTERWHHQQQIRAAVGARELLVPPWIHPLMELSVRALPRAYARLEAPGGTAVELEIPGVGTWTVERREEAWSVAPGAVPAPDCAVVADPATVWRLLFNALDVAAARERLQVTGDAALAEPLLHARAVMA